MEKISGILPNTKRIQFSDKSELAANRSPVVQKQIVAKTIESKVMPSSIESSVQAHREMKNWRTRDLAQARLVDTMAADFFVNNSKKPSEVVVTEIPAVDPGIDAAVINTRLGPSEEQSQAIVEDIGFEEHDLPESRLYPKGSFIDYVA